MPKVIADDVAVVVAFTRSSEDVDFAVAVACLERVVLDMVR